MSNSQPILLYLLIFLALSIVLKLFGIIDVGNIELLAYSFIFYGITLVYNSFVKNRALALFIGSSIFLTGFLLFLTTNFEFNDSNRIIFPAVLLIIGINFFMLFLADSERKSFLAISLTSIISAIIVIILLGSITFQNFFGSIINIFKKYWPVVLIVGGLIVFLNIEYKKKS